MITVDKTNNKGFSSAADDPKRLAQYLLYGDDYKRENVLHRVLCSGSINCASSDLEDAASLIAQLNYRYKQTATARSKNKLRTHHIIISLNAGEHLSAEQWYEVAESHLKALNLEEHLAFWAVHKDTDNEHLHLVFSDVNPNNLKINNLSKSHKKWLTLDKKLEERFSLKEDNHEKTHKMTGENLSDDLEAKTGQQSLFTYIKKFKTLLDQSKSWTEFHEICLKHNIKCVKLGRGIAFETDDPEKPNKKIYIKGSAFNKWGELKLSLSDLEKRLGAFIPFDENLDIQPISKYEAEPVNFENDDFLKYAEYGTSLNEAFDEYKRAKIKENENLHKLEDLKEELEYQYKYLKKQEKKKYLQKTKSIKKAFYNNISMLEEKLEQAEAEYKSKLDTLYTSYSHLKERFENSPIATRMPENFLSYLKIGIKTKAIQNRNLILLLSRKESRKQYHQNYLEFPRIRVNMSQGITQNLLNIKSEKQALANESLALHKITGKGQLIFKGKGKFQGDFIKDDGAKLMLNDLPSTKTIATSIFICKKSITKGDKVKCHGTNDFQRRFLELSLIQNLNISLSNQELNQEYELRKEEREKHRSEREKLRVFSNLRRIKQSKYVGRSIRRNGKQFGARRAFSRFRVESEIYNGSIQNTASPSTNRDHLSNADTGSIKQIRKTTRQKSSMRDLPKLHLAEDQNRTSMLLSINERDSMGKLSQRELLSGMRWQVSDKKRRGIENANSEVKTNYKEKDNSKSLSNFLEDIDKKLNSTNLSEHKELDQYIKERNNKFQQGYKDVLPHEKYQSQKGIFIYKGLRKLDKKFYALLEKEQIVYLKELEDEKYALERLKTTKNGTEVRISKNGMIINKNQKSANKRNFKKGK